MGAAIASCNEQTSKSCKNLVRPGTLTTQALMQGILKQVAISWMEDRRPGRSYEWRIRDENEESVPGSRRLESARLGILKQVVVSWMEVAWSWSLFPRASNQHSNHLWCHYTLLIHLLTHRTLVGSRRLTIHSLSITWDSLASLDHLLVSLAFLPFYQPLIFLDIHPIGLSFTWLCLPEWLELALAPSPLITVKKLPHPHSPLCPLYCSLKRKFISQMSFLSLPSLPPRSVDFSIHLRVELLGHKLV